MRGRNTFERAPVRLNIGAEKDGGQDRRQQPSYPVNNVADRSRMPVANYGPSPVLREPPRRKGYMRAKRLNICHNIRYSSLSDHWHFFLIKNI